MGLIGSVLALLFCGGSGFYMSPASFIKRPALWVELISRHRGTHMQVGSFHLHIERATVTFQLKIKLWVTKWLWPVARQLKIWVSGNVRLSTSVHAPVKQNVGFVRITLYHEFGKSHPRHHPTACTTAAQPLHYLFAAVWYWSTSWCIAYDQTYALIPRARNLPTYLDRNLA